MPKIDEKAYNEAAESTGGGISQMEPGVYRLRIMAIRTAGKDRDGKDVDYINDKQYVKLIYDVASGEHAGRYSDDYYAGEDRDYAHCDYLSWKNLGFLKSKLNILTETNPGFDAKAAFDGDNWEQFIGRDFYVLMDGTVDTNDRGYDRWILDIGQWLHEDDAVCGNHREPKITDNRTAVPDTSTSAVYDDIPFM